MSELDKAVNEAEKARGLSGVLDTVSKNDRFMDIAETAIGALIEKVGSKGGPDPLEGVEGTHRQHLEALINNLRTDPEFTKKVVAVAFKTKNNPEILDEIIAYLKNPEVGNTEENQTQEEITAESSLGGNSVMSWFGGNA